MNMQPHMIPQADDVEELHFAMCVSDIIKQ